MIRILLIDRAPLPPLLTATLLVVLAGNVSTSFAQGAPPAREALLRLGADSGVVGHYKFTMRETHRLLFDLPPDDPRFALLESAMAQRQRTTEVAVTIVSLPNPTGENRRYLLYWLGYRLVGDEVQSLSGLQWDSTFREVGRRAVLTMSPLGEPKGVEVTSEAVRPVGRAMAEIVSALALALPADSIGVGGTWVSGVSIPVRRPDGSRVMMPVSVTYRLTELADEREGLVAKIEFDGEPLVGVRGVDNVSGHYFGEGVFAVERGRYERMVAASKLEVRWSDSGGLPPSSSLVEWEGELNRSRGG